MPGYVPGAVPYSTTAVTVPLPDASMWASRPLSRSQPPPVAAKFTDVPSNASSAEPSAFTVPIALPQLVRRLTASNAAGET